MRNIKKVIQLTMILLCFQLSLFARNINFNVNNVSVKSAMETLTKESGYSFVFESGDVNTQKIISVKLQNRPIDEVVKQILQGQDVSFTIKDKNIIVRAVEQNTQSAPAQDKKQVQGVVKDNAGEPVIGANISEKNTKNGTATDVNGKFSLSVNPGTVLVVSYIGYTTQEITVGNETNFTVTLHESIGILDEVVVVGFGTQKKVNLTGAVATVSAKDLQNRPVTRVSHALQGMVPGLNIQNLNGMAGGAPNIDIRGVGNLGTGSSAAPLILIDGVEGDLQQVNAQDIENMSVLKDAAASSIYGSRAPFGVILITTKKGVAGQSKVNYTNNFSWQTPTIWPNRMDSYTFATYVNAVCDNSGWSHLFSDERVQRIKDFMNGTSDVRNIPNPQNPTQWSNPYNEGSDNIDIYKVLFKNYSFMQEHNVSASGGNNRMTYYMGLLYLGQSGLLKIADENFSKIAPTLTVEAQLTDWMKLRYTTRFIRENNSRPRTLSQGVFNQIGKTGWPTLTVYDMNGHLSDGTPVLDMVEGGRYDNQSDRFNNHAGLTLEPLKNWVTVAEFNYNVTTGRSHSYGLPVYFYDVAGNPTQSSADWRQGFVSNSFSKSNFLNMNLYSSYHFSLNDQHNFSVMAGTQMESLSTVDNSLSRNGLVTPTVLTINMTTGLDYYGNKVAPTVGGGMGEWSTAGYFGRFNYDWQGRYLLEANLRYDGTSRFRGDRQWNWFPSFSAGWNIAREDFWGELAKTVSTLKFRGSYGTLGNQNTNNWYPTYEIFSTSAASGAWLQNGARPNTASSPNLISSSLSWEKINTWDAGVDVSALNNRLTGSFDYYVRKTLDMIGPAVELPVILGKSVPQSNNTDLKTYGFELELGWQDRLSNGLFYSARFLLSDYQTEITRYPNATKSLGTYYEGQKFGNIWGYETIGIAKSNEEMEAHLASLPDGGQNALGSQWLAGDIMYKDLNNDRKIDAGKSTLDDPGDRKIIGNTTPRYQFGLDLNAAWKGFDLRVFFQGVGKRDFATYSSSFWEMTNGWYWEQVPLMDHLDFFRAEPYEHLPANLDAYYPRPLFDTGKNQQIQSRYLQDASYIRLKNLSVGYTLPQAFTRKFSVEGLRLYVSGENLWLGTNMAKMFDPEAVYGFQGDSGEYYPIQKTISFGLSVTL